MEKHIPALEPCKECGELKMTVWEDTGFTVKQKHKIDCSVLKDLKKKYPETYYPTTNPLPDASSGA